MDNQNRKPGSDGSHRGVGGGGETTGRADQRSPEAVLIPVSHGELLDKITILRIKRTKAGDPAKRKNVEVELAELEAVWRTVVEGGAAVEALTQALQRVNERLWDIEDRIREHEAAERFDAAFVALARSVYINNDERAALKREVNKLLCSRLVEEKFYAPYSRPPDKTGG